MREISRNAYSPTYLLVSSLFIDESNRLMKGDLEALGEDVDENVESISKMQTQILNLTHGKVNIFDNEGNFRNIYNIMKDIADVYDELKSTEQADLLETIAGKQRANAVQALIQNFSRVEKATEAAYNAAGTAAQEQAIYMESIEGRVNSLEAAWQGLSNTVINSGLVKSGVSLLTDLTIGLDSIIDKVDTIPTLLTVATAALSFKNIGRDRMFSLA